MESGGVECIREEAEEPEQQFLRKETDEIIRQKVQQLPDKYRVVIYLYYSAELKIKEIAQCLHITEKCREEQDAQGKNMLKKDLEDIRYEG